MQDKSPAFLREKMEFFAVATESFFTQPRDLRQVHPELYQVLARYFRQDPAAEWSSDENHPPLGEHQGTAETGGEQ